MNEGWRSPSFLWVYSFSHSFSFSFSFSSPCFGFPAVHPLLMIHSLFKYGRLLGDSGNEVSSHIRRADFGFQLLPHVGHWHLHVAPSVCPTGQAWEDKRLVSSTQQLLWVDPSEVILSTKMFLLLKQKPFNITLLPSPGRSRENKAPHRHHHSGGQGLWRGAVCVCV